MITPNNLNQELHWMSTLGQILNQLVKNLL